MASPARRVLLGWCRSPLDRRGGAAGLAVWLALLAWLVVIVWRGAQSLVVAPDAFVHLLDWRRFLPADGRLLVRHWLQTAWHCLLLLGLVASAYGCGRSVLGRIVPQLVRPPAAHAAWSRLERLLLMLGTGLACLVLLLFLLGAIGLYRVVAVGPVLAVLAVLGGFGLWYDRQLLQPVPGWLLGRSPGLADRLLLVVVGLFLATVALAVNAPEIAFDSLVYHLAVPAAWIRHGGIQVLPYSYYSNLPMGTEMLYTAGLLLGDERLCRMVHASLGLLSGLAVFAIGRRWLGRRAGLWGAAIFLTVPMLSLNMATAGSDSAAVLFSTLAVASLLVWAHHDGSRRDELGIAFLAGLLAGAACASKYNVVFALVPMLAATAGLRLLARRSTVRRLLGSGLVLAVGGLLLVGPWLAKNLVYTGNPFCPFLSRQLPTRYLHPDKISNQMEEFREYGRRGPGEILRQPWDLSFAEPTSNGFLGVVLLFLLPVVLVATPTFCRRGPPVLVLLLLATAGGTLLWTSKTQIARYLIPVLPLASLLGAAALKTWETAGRFLRASVGTARAGILLLMLWAWATTLTMVQASWDPVGAALGLEARASYLRRVMMQSYQPMVEPINRLPDDAAILAFGETRSYYIERRIVAPSVFDFSPLLVALQEADSAEQVWRRLRNDGFTHLYLHLAEAERTRGYEPYRWQEPVVERLQQLLAHYLQLTAAADRQYLYQLRAEPDPSEPVRHGRPLLTYDPEVVAAVRPLYQRSLVMAGQGRLAEAGGLWRQLVSIVPRWHLPQMQLAGLALVAGQDQEALHRFETADQLGLLSPAAYHQMAMLYLADDQPAAARRYLQTALQQDPDSPELRLALAQAKTAEAQQRSAAGG